MNILIITHYSFGSKSSGATNRTLELAKAMSEYASIKVIHRGPNIIVKNLQFIGYESMFSYNSSNWVSDAVSPYISYAFPDFYRVVKTVIDEADVVQVEQPYLLIPILMLTKAMGKDPLIVLDEHNVDFTSVKSKISGVSLNSVLTTVTLPYVFLLEKLAVKYASLILCVSQTDRELFMNLYGVPRNKLVIIQNGVNFDKIEKTLPANDPLLDHNKTIFFHGTLSWYPNLEAANIIVDYLAPKIPEATFLIAGANPPVSLVKKIEKTRNVRYLGYIECLVSWIKASSICIAPILRGGGTKLKILEYLAAGKPIVATFKAVEGLGIVNYVHGLFYKDINKDFVDGIRRLLNNDQSTEELGRNARKFVKNYDWAIIGKKLYKVYLEQLDNIGHSVNSHLAGTK